MKEELLHFIWKYSKFPLNKLFTTAGESVAIVEVGWHNHLAGPDFVNSKIRIADQLWAGTVEIHISSSDWYAHNHEKDPNYDNVILHVVWEDTMPVVRKDGSLLPVLLLSNYVPNSLLASFNKLMKPEKFINCNTDINSLEDIKWHQWLDRLYFERLSNKAQVIESLLLSSNNDWEQLLFSLLLKGFGSKINGDSFLMMGRNIDFSMVKKMVHNPFQLEALLFGMSGLLEHNSTLDNYFDTLKLEYTYVKHKFNINTSVYLKPSFFKLRPANFPTIRLSQFAIMYANTSNLFSKIINLWEVTELRKCFQSKASKYWDTHYVFGKETHGTAKKLSTAFIDLLIINVVIPVKFSYFKFLGEDKTTEIVALISSVVKEENRVVKKYAELGVKISNAFQSQALLELHANYCSKNKCLQCQVGASLLSRNV